MLGCVAGLLRLRPLVAAGSGLATAAAGFVAVAAMAPVGGRDMPERLAAAQAEVAQTAPAAIPGPITVAAMLPAVPEAAAPPAPMTDVPADVPPGAVRLPSEPGVHPAVDQIVQVGRGDTLMKLIMDAGIDRTEAHEAIAALEEVYDPRRLRVGQAIKLTYTPGGAGSTAKLIGMRVEKSFDREAGAGRIADGRFEPFEIEKQLDLRMARASGSIRNSLFEDGTAEGVPARIMVAFIRLFSYDIDFQRDIHAGDGFDLIFERYHGEEGEIAHEGEVQYAALTVGGKTHRLFRFETLDGEVDYFDENGQSVRKALLRTPIDGARLTSGFGMRRHPILGYSRMHRGVDFAAPTGTPVMAAGSGVVEFVGRRGGYGKYIQIRHNSDYNTAYAHLSAYASGLERGQRVKQGDVIGYVGSTGRSTGPHLHYEVLQAGDQISPIDLKLPSGVQLAGKDLLRFRIFRKRIEERLDRMPSSTLVAQAPDR